MARIRTVKPEFWTDEKVVTVSRDARLLFIGIWNFVDDFGRVEFSPFRLKMQIFPADSVEVSPLLQELEEASLIQIYEIENKRYLNVPNFRKHQTTKSDAKEKHPRPPKSAEPSRKVPLEKEKGMEKGKSSVPNGTGAHAPTASQWIYAKSKELLALADKPPSDPGALVTKWLKQHGEESMLHALRMAEMKRSPDPIAYIEGVLRGGKRQQGPPPVARDVTGRPLKEL